MLMGDVQRYTTVISLSHKDKVKVSVYPIIWTPSSPSEPLASTDLHSKVKYNLHTICTFWPMLVSIEAISMETFFLKVCGLHFRISSPNFREKRLHLSTIAYFRFLACEVYLPWCTQEMHTRLNSRIVCIFVRLLELSEVKPWTFRLFYALWNLYSCADKKSELSKPYLGSLHILLKRPFNLEIKYVLKVQSSQKWFFFYSNLLTYLSNVVLP